MPASAAARHRNEVTLVGALEGPPQARTPRSGEEIVTFRLRVESELAGTPVRDSLECTARTSRVRRAVAGWAPGDVVAVTGALRRRFYRAGAASRPFVVVEVTSARRAARG